MSLRRGARSLIRSMRHCTHSPVKGGPTLQQPCIKTLNHYTTCERYAILVADDICTLRKVGEHSELSKALLHLSLRSQRDLEVAHLCERIGVPSN